MKIIDFEKAGNVVRFFFGADDNDKYWGDDWNDYPYECNAGKVYDDHIVGYIDAAFDLDHIVVEPQDGLFDDSHWCKQDFKDRKCPCIVVINKKDYSAFSEDFNIVVANKNAVKFYFGDNLGQFKDNLEAIGGHMIQSHLV